MGNKDTNVFKRDSLTVKRREQGAVRMFISIIVFTALSVGASCLRFNIPLLPFFISVEFSVFFELIAAIAYGPIVAAIVCLLKGVIYSFIVPNGIISNISAFVVEGTFVVVAGIYYHKTIFAKRKHGSKDKNRKERGTIHRRKTIIKGSFIAMIPTLILQFIMTSFFTYPMLENYYWKRGYSTENILASYNESFEAISSRLPESLGKLVPRVSQIWQGTLLVNVSLTFVKLAVVVLAVALIYPIISPYIHFRKRRK